MIPGEARLSASGACRVDEYGVRSHPSYVQEVCQPVRGTKVENYTLSSDANPQYATVSQRRTRTDAMTEGEALAMIDAARAAAEWAESEPPEERQRRHERAMRDAVLREVGGQHG